MSKASSDLLIRALLIVAVSALLAAIYSATFLGIGQICWSNDDYSHGLFLPFAGIYLIWTKRQEIKDAWTANVEKGAASVKWRALGFVLLLAGALILMVTRLMDMQGSVIQWMSFFIVISGIFLVTLRANVVGLILPPILLCYMAKPIPDSMVPRLFNPFQTFAATVSSRVLETLDVPVHSVGNVIEIPGMRLMVEEACSGMRSLMALTTVALIVLMVIPFPNWMRILVFLFSIVLALVLNVIRVAATGVLAYFVSHDAATGFFHTFSGLVVFIVGLVILFGLANKLADLMEARKQKADEMQSDVPV